MLNKVKTLAVSGALVLAAGGAFAEVHEVSIFDNDFMPPVVFASPGDSIVFLNEDEVNREARAEDDSWATGEIEPGETATILISNATTLEYVSPDEDGISEDANSVDAGNVEDGEVVFAPAPLE